MSVVDSSRAYFDVQGLNRIKTDKPEEQLQQAADLFETQFLQLVLKQMRSASEALSGGDTLFGSREQTLFREMHDAQLAQTLSQKNNLGISEMLVKQFSGLNTPQESEMTDRLKQASNSTALQKEAQSNELERLSGNISVLSNEQLLSDATAKANALQLSALTSSLKSGI